MKSVEVFKLCKTCRPLVPLHSEICFQNQSLPYGFVEIRLMAAKLTQVQGGR